MPVLGIGGFFFRAQDPDARPLIFAPFVAGTDYWAVDKQFMLNLRVRDIDGLLEGLNASGVAVIVKPEWDSPEAGRFARINDPEGNAIELWEPPPAGGDVGSTVTP
jgi:hypothetical protein